MIEGITVVTPTWSRNKHSLQIMMKQYDEHVDIHSFIVVDNDVDYRNQRIAVGYTNLDFNKYKKILWNHHKLDLSLEESFKYGLKYVKTQYALLVEDKYIFDLKDIFEVINTIIAHNKAINGTIYLDPECISNFDLEKNKIKRVDANNYKLEHKLRLIDMKNPDQFTYILNMRNCYAEYVI